MLDLCLLGTGGMMPIPGRWLTSLLVRYNGRMILIDCGEGTQIPLKMAEWGLKNIDAICFTHYHADHIAGLPGLLLTIGNSGREEPLTLIGPPGLGRVVGGLTVISPELPFDLKIEEIPDTADTMKQIGEVWIHSVPVEHTIPCLAYGIEIKRAGRFEPERAKAQNIPMMYWGRLQKGERITHEGFQYEPSMVLGAERKGIKICYCTDTRPTYELEGFIKDADVLICEGMYGEDEKLDKAIEKKHMLFSEAAGLAKRGNVKELWLTHYSPSISEPELYMSSVENIFGNTLPGKDLMKKTLTFEEEK